VSASYLTIEEVAQETRSPLSTVRHWIAVGKLKSARPGKRVIVRRDWLDAFLEAATRGGDE